MGSGFVCGGMADIEGGPIFKDVLERGSLALNAATFLCILVFYIIEFLLPT